MCEDHDGLLTDVTAEQLNLADNLNNTICERTDLDKNSETSLGLYDPYTVVESCFTLDGASNTVFSGIDLTLLSRYFKT